MNTRQEVKKMCPACEKIETRAMRVGNSWHKNKRNETGNKKMFNLEIETDEMCERA